VNYHTNPIIEQQLRLACRLTDLHPGAAQQFITHHNSVLGGWFAEVKPASEIEFAGAG